MNGIMPFPSFKRQKPSSYSQQELVRWWLLFNLKKFNPDLDLNIPFHVQLLSLAKFNADEQVIAQNLFEQQKFLNDLPPKVRETLLDSLLADRCVRRVVRMAELASKEAEFDLKLARLSALNLEIAAMDNELAKMEEILAAKKADMDDKIAAMDDKIAAMQKILAAKKAELKDQDEDPELFKDNVFTLDVMNVPVIAADGFTYEKRCIAEWFKTKRTSPTTGALLTNTNLIPNNSLKSQINQWKEERARERSVVVDTCAVGGCAVVDE
jgi:hypothetical protein